MEWRLLMPCCVLSVVAFFLAPILTYGYSSSSSSSSSRLLFGYQNDSSSSSFSPSSSSSTLPSIGTKSQITISLLKSQKHWLKKGIWRLENKISTEYPISEESAEGYYNNSEISRVNNDNDDDVQTNTIYTTESSCWLGISCEEFSSETPPHDVIKLIPPPPLPLYLFQLELLPERKNLEEFLYLIDQFDFQSYYLIEKKNDDGGREEKVFRVNPTWLSSYDVAYGCTLCKWARKNSTESLFIAHSSNTGNKKKWKWIETLIVVGCVSGIFGAIFACFLTRIKFLIRIFGESKEKNEPPLPEYVAGSDMAYFTDTFNGRRQEIEDTNLSNDRECLGQSDSQKPQESQGSHETPSSDSEDTYVNGSSVYLRFSEVASKTGEIESDSTMYYDPMSLDNNIENCCRDGIIGMNPQNESTCSPAASSDITTSSLNPLGTSSTPSSAYYSDMSVFELPSYRKKKKKRKGDSERKIRRSSVQVSDNYSPTLANHLVNIKHPLKLCNEADFQVHNFNENSHQNLTHLNIASNYPHNNVKCSHNSQNYNQNRNIIPENTYDLCQTSPSDIFDTVIPSASQLVPKCIHYTSECLKYIPTLSLKNTNLNITSILQNPYIVNEETVPALIKHFDKNSTIEHINNNISSDNTTKLTNSMKFTELMEKENCNCVSSQPPKVLGLEDNSILAEKKQVPLVQQQCTANYFNPFSELCRGEQDIYRLYSSSEVPSEYI